MKLETKIKTIIGIGVVFAVGFIGFQALHIDPPETEVTYKTVKPERRRITMFPHVVRIRETGTQAQIETENVEFPEMETPSVPDAVPTAQSSDDEIREFEAWLSSILTEEDTPEKTEMEDLQVETDEIDYELEISHIKFVITVNKDMASIFRYIHKEQI